MSPEVFWTSTIIKIFDQENIEIVDSEIVRVTNNVEILDNQKFYRMRINLN